MGKLIVRFSQSTEHRGVFNYALKVEVVGSVGIPTKIFVYHQSPAGLDGNSYAEFDHIASPVDFQEIPEDAASDVVPWYRTDKCTVWVRSVSDLEMAKQLFVDDINALQRTYDVLTSENNFTQQTTVEFASTGVCGVPENEGGKSITKEIEEMKTDIEAKMPKNAMADIELETNTPEGMRDAIKSIGNTLGARIVRGLITFLALSSLCTSCSYGAGFSGQNINDLDLDEDPFVVTNVTFTMESMSWSDLVAKRNSGDLIPGQEYRITNYWATSNGDMESRSATNQFDIIVVADATNILNETARAARHDGDSYFPSSTKFGAWRLQYCLDNDSSRFDWTVSDADGGRGVVYRMVDEFYNDIPYDFKSIQFIPFGDTSSDYRYTIGTSSEDMTLYGHGNWAFGNHIEPHYRVNGTSQGLRQKLNRIVFKSYACFGNKIGEYSRNITFNRYSCDNTFGPNCRDMSVGRPVGVNVGAYCSELTFTNFTSDPRLLSSHKGAHVGEGCISCSISEGSSIGTRCDSCTVGIGSHIGDSCSNVSVGDNSVVGSGCKNVFAGSSCEVGSGCDTVYVSASSSVIGPGCTYVYLANKPVTIFNETNEYALGALTWKTNSYSLKKCSQAGVGNSALFENVVASDITTPSKSLNIGPGIRYLVLCATNNPTSASSYQHVEVKSGVSGVYRLGVSEPKIIHDPNVGQTFNTTYKPAGSLEISVE